MVVGGRVVAFPYPARTRRVLVSLSCRCGGDPYFAGKAEMHSCSAWATAGLGVGGHRSGRCGAGDPRVLPTESAQPPRRTCTHADEPTAGPAGGAGRSRATAGEAGGLNATSCRGCCCCSGCEGRRGARGTHPRWEAVGCLFAGQVRDGYATSARDLMGRWQHGGTVGGCAGR